MALTSTESSPPADFMMDYVNDRNVFFVRKADGRSMSVKFQPGQYPRGQYLQQLQVPEVPSMVVDRLIEPASVVSHVKRTAGANGLRAGAVGRGKHATADESAVKIYAIISPEWLGSDNASVFEPVKDLGKFIIQEPVSPVLLA